MEILSGLPKGKILLSFTKGGPFEGRHRETSPRSLPMQNCTHSGSSHFSTPQSNIDVSCQRHQNKRPHMDKIWDKNM